MGRPVTTNAANNALKSSLRLHGGVEDCFAFLVLSTTIALDATAATALRLARIGLPIAAAEDIDLNAPAPTLTTERSQLDSEAKHDVCKMKAREGEKSIIFEWPNQT
jgi:hypothetical protein